MKKLATLAMVAMMTAGVMTSCSKKQDSAAQSASTPAGSTAVDNAIKTDEQQDVATANAYMVDVKGDTVITNANGTKSVVTLDTMTPETVATTAAQ